MGMPWRGASAILPTHTHVPYLRHMAAGAAAAAWLLPHTHLNRLASTVQEFRGGLEGDVGYTTHSRVPWTAAYEKQLHNLSS
jgi:hypothetical protein